jgi:hypothetical protein
LADGQNNAPPDLASEAACFDGQLVSAGGKRREPIISGIRCPGRPPKACLDIRRRDNGARDHGSRLIGHFASHCRQLTLGLL